jgi:hypothetical protein
MPVYRRSLNGAVQADSDQDFFYFKCVSDILHYESIIINQLFDSQRATRSFLIRKSLRRQRFLQEQFTFFDQFGNGQGLWRM